MAAIDEVSASVEVDVWVNGKKIDVEDLAVGLYMLMTAGEAILPELFYDDTTEQKALRKAVQFARDLGVFK